jgi:calcium binding protein 39
MFKKSKKTPAELVRALSDAIEVPDRKKDSKHIDRHLEKASEQVNKYLAQMRLILYGDDAAEPDAMQVAELIDAAVAANLPLFLVRDMAKVGFEARKDIAAVLTSMLRRERQQRPPPLATYLHQHQEVPDTLLLGYNNPDLALTCGAILREMLRSEPLCSQFLADVSRVRRLFAAVELSNFDIASDAFATLRDVFTRHKGIVADFFEREYEELFEAQSSQQVRAAGVVFFFFFFFLFFFFSLVILDHAAYIQVRFRTDSRHAQYTAITPFHLRKQIVNLCGLDCGGRNYLEHDSREKKRKKPKKKKKN